eukprot:5426672-Pyramimonas_sp.AAC.1
MPTGARYSSLTNLLPKFWGQVVAPGCFADLELCRRCRNLTLGSVAQIEVELGARTRIGNNRLQRPHCPLRLLQ